MVSGSMSARCVAPQAGRAACPRLWASDARPRANVRAHAAPSKGQKPQLLFGVMPPQPPAKVPPAYVAAPVAIGAIVLVVKLVKWLRRGSGSASALQERGLQSENNGQVMVDDTFYQKRLKSVGKIKWEGVSEADMIAARERRRAQLEAEGANLNLEEIDIPTDHPFLTRTEVSQEEQDEIQQRLLEQARRMADDGGVRRRRPTPAPKNVGPPGGDLDLPDPN
ncbi:unnamed protein product [Pedinophyceae sp. YPF-701]|nr:unnamed protein product [Pedinophyceae sp. YPF-701]